MKNLRDLAAATGAILKNNGLVESDDWWMETHKAHAKKFLEALAQHPLGKKHFNYHPELPQEGQRTITTIVKGKNDSGVSYSHHDDGTHFVRIEHGMHAVGMSKKSAKDALDQAHHNYNTQHAARRAELENQAKQAQMALDLHNQKALD